MSLLIIIYKKGRINYFNFFLILEGEFSSRLFVKVLTISLGFNYLEILNHYFNNIFSGKSCRGLMY